VSTRCVRHRFVASVSTSCNNAVILSSCYKLPTHNLLTNCRIAGRCNKSVELNNLVANCQQAGNKQCEHILLTSCWNSIATSLLQVCYNLCVFMLRHKSWKLTVFTFGEGTVANSAKLWQSLQYLKWKMIPITKSIKRIYFIVFNPLSASALPLTQ
jgi:hypothetical protein